MEPIERINARPLPFAALLGIEFLTAEADRVTARMTVRPDLCTLGSIVHGGVLMAFADTLGAAATSLNLPAEATGTTTLESKTNFIAGAPVGAVLLASCAAVHRGRRTQVWQTRVETEAGCLVALVTQTQLVL
jgi:1,4-dihydroxy-2-naphthoyl-CoA hydrolase